MDTSIYKDSEALHLWVHLLMNAKLEETIVSFRNKTFKLKRSQLVTTTTQLAEETGIDRTKIQRLGILLTEEKMIRRKPENLCTVVTILQYEKYQPAYDPSIVIIDENQILTEEDVNQIMMNWKVTCKETFEIKGKFALGLLINRRRELENKSLKYAKSMLCMCGALLNDDFSCERIIEEDTRLKEVMAL